MGLGAAREQHSAGSTRWSLMLNSEVATEMFPTTERASTSWLHDSQRARAGEQSDAAPG